MIKGDEKLPELPSMDDVIFFMAHAVPLPVLIAGIIGMRLQGFYTMLQVVVFAGSLLCVGLAYYRGGGRGPWSLWLLILGLLFNPFGPPALGRTVWVVMDLIAAVSFVAHFWVHKDARP